MIQGKNITVLVAVCTPKNILLREHITGIGDVEITPCKKFLRRALHFLIHIIISPERIQEALCVIHPFHFRLCPRLLNHLAANKSCRLYLCIYIHNYCNSCIMCTISSNLKFVNSQHAASHHFNTLKRQFDSTFYCRAAYTPDYL